MLEANGTKVLRKIVGKTKIGSVRSQQIRESCFIQPINKWVERRREWDEHVTRMDAERLVKISKEISYLPEGDLQDLREKEGTTILG